MVIHKKTRLTPIQREKVCTLYFSEKRRVCDLAREFHVSRPTIYKIIHNGRQKDYSIHKSVNKRFRCLKYGIKRLAKIEKKLEDKLKRQAKRYNKDYPGQMIHGDTKKLPLIKGGNLLLNERNTCLWPLMTFPENCMLLFYLIKPNIQLKSFWSKSWMNVHIQ